MKYILYILSKINNILQNLIKDKHFTIKKVWFYLC